ncbi:MAG: GTPase [Oscillospiraceae bacterium]|nr:GTPase [Oscillospiraceae bacterium]MBQ8010300.1 GTPase [Oscillospiraceae bacterium]MBQ9111065.1 GTPase [Oscillospiraceae bacterium]
MNQMEDVPVYLFVGFLESGKTKFIQETLEDARFNNGEKTLLLLCEEGEEEYDLSRYPGNNVTMHVIEDKEDFNEENLRAVLKKSGATRVVLEYNGMWTIQEMFDALPMEWAVYQAMCFVDSNTFLSYNANMRGLVVDKINVSELVVFNRFAVGEMDQVEFHKIVRGISRRTQIAYETTDGEVAYDDIEDPLPFDVEAPEIDLKDEDFALWYRDIMEEPEKYHGKIMTFRGVVALDPQFPKGVFAVGRHVMTCCVDDIQYCWLAAEWNKASLFETRQWVRVRGKICVQKHKLYRGKGPVLQVQEVILTDAPEQEVATFY